MASAGNPKDDTGLERKMESRHLTMISLGGVIGTGLFVSSGYTIHQAGPLGAILAYAVGSLLVHTLLADDNKTARDPKEGLKLLAAKSEELAEGIHNAR